MNIPDTPAYSHLYFRPLHCHKMPNWWFHLLGNRPQIGLPALMNLASWNQLRSLGRKKPLTTPLNDNAPVFRTSSEPSWNEPSVQLNIRKCCLLTKRQRHRKFENQSLTVFNAKSWRKQGTLLSAQEEATTCVFPASIEGIFSVLPCQSKGQILSSVEKEVGEVEHFHICSIGLWTPRVELVRCPIVTV